MRRKRGAENGLTNEKTSTSHPHIANFKELWMDGGEYTWCNGLHNNLVLRNWTGLWLIRIGSTKFGPPKLLFLPSGGTSNHRPLMININKDHNNPTRNLNGDPDSTMRPSLTMEDILNRVFLVAFPSKITTYLEDFTKEDVKAAIGQIHPPSKLRKDGSPGLFYHNHWEAGR
uniref:Uncharacterized protein n=1 Tax=Cannabis sativa TaxID=3483 RepID=A0A803NTE9_CANSA